MAFHEFVIKKYRYSQLFAFNSWNQNLIDYFAEIIVMFHAFTKLYSQTGSSALLDSDLKVPYYTNFQIFHVAS